MYGTFMQKIMFAIGIRINVQMGIYLFIINIPQSFALCMLYVKAEFIFSISKIKEETLTIVKIVSFVLNIEPSSYQKLQPWQSKNPNKIERNVQNVSR